MPLDLLPMLYLGKLTYDIILEAALGITGITYFQNHPSLVVVRLRQIRGPFKYYVMQWVVGWSGVKFLCSTHVSACA